MSSMPDTNGPFIFSREKIAEDDIDNLGDPL
jgi:hypothetical protein